MKEENLHKKKGNKIMRTITSDTAMEILQALSFTKMNEGMKRIEEEGGSFFEALTLVNKSAIDAMTSFEEYCNEEEIVSIKMTEDFAGMHEGETHSLERFLTSNEKDVKEVTSATSEGAKELAELLDFFKTLMDD